MYKASQRRTLTGDFGLLEYTLTRKKVKNINLRVHPDGEVLVSAPSRCPQREIDLFLRSRIQWIRQVQSRCMPAQNSMLPYSSGQTLLCLGRRITLQLHTGPQRVEMEQNELHLTLPQPQNQEMVRRMLERFSDDYCRQIFSTLLDQVYPITKPWNIPFPALRIRLMTSRWGSCIPGKRVITLNKALIQAPVECVEYVILHELAHFLHPDHSSRFHRQMDLWLPDWKAKRALLRDVPVTFWYSREKLSEEPAETKEI